MVGKIHIILLAAGQGRRFGGNKLLHRLEGKELYRYLPDTLQSLSGERIGVRCIVSQYPEIIDEMNRRNYQCVMNEMPELGISHSIFLGISRLEEMQALSGGDAVLFGVCDQPYLKAETLQGFLEAYQKSGKGIGCVRCGDKSGNPVIFDVKYLEELKALQGDRGGKRVVKKHPEDVCYYEVSDARELQDIDTRKRLWELAFAEDAEALLAEAGLERRAQAVIAVVGAGGKTTIAYALAGALQRAGKKVLVTTTTHMFEPEEHYIEWEKTKTTDENLRKITETVSACADVWTVGVRAGNAKIKGIPEEIKKLSETVEFLIVEADGSKQMPFKVPAAHEPVIPACADYVIGVMGYPAIGKAIRDVSHRPGDVAAFLGKELTETITAGDMINVMTSKNGLLKDVHVPYTLILNRCPRKADEDFIEKYEKKLSGQHIALWKERIIKTLKDSESD